MQQAVAAMKELILQNTQQNQEYLDQLLSWLSHIYIEGLQGADTLHVSLELPPTIEVTDLELLRDSMVHHVQYLIYLRY